MKKFLNKLIIGAILSIMIFLSSQSNSTVKAIGTGLTLSPMYQKAIVNPGEKQELSFRISNPSAAVKNVYYDLSVEPFYVDEKGDVVYQAEAEMGEITDWVEFSVPTKGKIEPNEVKEITFSINVPESAPAGGQYFSVMITEVENDESEGQNDYNTENDKKTAMKEIFKMAHLVYTEVTGKVIRQGEIENVALPSFILSGDITGSASIKNTGNVHDDAIYTMQIFPLFSDEEIYSSEETPETVTILPDRTAYHKTSWNNTPGIGIFNVIYTVEFGDSVAQVKKLVIKCPIWLLFVIIFTIVTAILWFMAKRRERNKKEA